MWHAWGGGVYTVFVGDPNVGDHCEDLDIGGRITLSWTLGRQGSMGLTGFAWLRIRSSGRLL
jgi:hypothetical protein